MEKIIVTTSFKVEPEKIAEAKRLAQDWGLPYLERKKYSIRSLIGDGQGALVVYQDNLIYCDRSGVELSFHPDTAILRIKADRDPLLELIGPTPKKILDATMGLATDSLVIAAGGHQVTALESEWLTHLVISRGLETFETSFLPLKLAIDSIQTVWSDHLSFLRQQEDQSFDVVYFDPMFSNKISESKNLEGITPLANPAPLSREVLEEAKRVAREKIILKAHFRDPILEDLGFIRHRRPNQKFHYGEFLVEDR